jgi:hypothetical protein
VSTTSTDAALRCPQCAAHVRAGSEWCTLCYADLRPAPQGAQVPDEPAEDVHAGTPAIERVETLPAVLPESAVGGEADAAPAPRRGKHAKHAATASTSETEAIAAQLLARLAAEESSVPLGRLTELTDTPGKKVGLIIGGGVTFLLVCLTLMTIIGLVV